MAATLNVFGIQQGSFLDGLVQLKRRLGEGSFGCVFEACVPVGTRPDLFGGARQIAVKVLDVPRSGRAAMQIKEIEIIQSLDHPNIVKCYGAWIDSPSGSLCIAMQLCTEGDLEKLMSQYRSRRMRFSQDDVKHYAAQLFSAVGYAHSHHVFHRDVKPANLLLRRDANGKLSLCLADFGISKLTMNDATRTRTGSPSHLAPEIVDGVPYTRAVDAWSIGVVLYEMMTLERPFDGSNIQQLYESIRTHDPIPKLRQKTMGLYDDILVTIVAMCLTRDPKHRVTCSAVMGLFPQILYVADACKLPRFSSPVARRSGSPIPVRRPPVSSPRPTQQLQQREDSIQQYASPPPPVVMRRGSPVRPVLRHIQPPSVSRDRVSFVALEHCKGKLVSMVGAVAFAVLEKYVDLRGSAGVTTSKALDLLRVVGETAFDEKEVRDALG